MAETQGFRVRLIYAAALFVIFTCVWMAPSQASAQQQVTIVCPLANSTVTGITTVEASMTFDIQVAGVQFLLDGANLGGEDTNPPYQVSWDTSTASNGSHVLTAVARDNSGNAFVSDSITIVVSNGAPPTVRRFEETDPSVAYVGLWRAADPRPWSGGAAVVSQTPGAQATFAFTGTSVSWIGWRGPLGGIARVFLDGALVAEVDTYASPEEVQAVIYMATSLANTSHTLTIDVTGTRNVLAAEATIVVDAFDVTSAPANAAATTVNFDTPPPSGTPGPLKGVFQGIDFGVAQWSWEGPFDVNPTNHVFFADSTGTSRSFAFSPAPRVLESVRVFCVEPGTLTLVDDTGQTQIREVSPGSMQLVATGWARPSTTVTVSFTSGWALGVDDITYRAAP